MKWKQEQPLLCFSDEEGLSVHVVLHHIALVPVTEFLFLSIIFFLASYIQF